MFQLPIIGARGHGRGPEPMEPEDNGNEEDDAEAAVLQEAQANTNGR